VDTELVYAYAKNKDLGPLEEFITSSHLANLQAVGDRSGLTHNPLTGRCTQCKL